MTADEETRVRELTSLIAKEADDQEVVMLAAELELLLTIKLEETNQPVNSR